MLAMTAEDFSHRVHHVLYYSVQALSDTVDPSTESMQSEEKITKLV